MAVSHSLRNFPPFSVLGVKDLSCGKGGVHGGPTCRYDSRVGFKAVRGIPGEWKTDPMGGGGINEEPNDVVM